MADNFKELEATWDKLAKTFNNWAGIRPRKSWFTVGLSERAGYNRVRVVENGKNAGIFYDLTKELKERELRYLLKRAEINLEQAQTAARVSSILNGSLIIGLIVIINQLLPGALAKFGKMILTYGRFGDIVVMALGLLAMFSMVITILSYSYGGTAQARDLKHLLELSLARRSFHDGKRQKDAALKPEEVLRENFLTDI